MAEDLKSKGGVDEIMIYCVNDGAVMQAWSEAQGVSTDLDDGSVLHLFGDPTGVLTEKLDMELTAVGPKSIGLLNRCKRFAMYVVNGKVEILEVAEAPDDPAGDDRPDVTLADAMLEKIVAWNAKNKSDEL